MKSQDFPTWNQGIFRLAGLRSFASGKVPDVRCAFTCEIFYLTCVQKFPPTKSIFCALKQKYQYHCKKNVHFPAYTVGTLNAFWQVRVICDKRARYLLLAVCVWWNRGAGALLRAPLPLWSPYLPAFTPHLHSAAHISSHLDIPVYLSMGGPSGTKINPLTPMPADPGYTCLSAFRNRLNLTTGFAVVFHVEEDGGWPHGRRGSFSKRTSPIVMPLDHLTCGFYSWPHNVCVGGGYYLCTDSASPYSLTPQGRYSGQI